MPGGEISVSAGGEYGRAWTFKTEEEADEFVDLVTRKVTAIIDPTPNTPFTFGSTPAKLAPASSTKIAASAAAFFARASRSFCLCAPSPI